MSTRLLTLLGALVLALTLALLPVGAGAQEAASSVEMRHFWHVFIAYAIAWTFLFSWVVSILRRVKRVEERLGGR